VYLLAPENKDVPKEKKEEQRGRSWRGRVTRQKCITTNWKTFPCSKVEKYE
jgi:hypothetical protein